MCCVSPSDRPRCYVYVGTYNIEGVREELLTHSFAPKTATSSSQPLLLYPFPGGAGKDFFFSSSSSFLERAKNSITDCTKIGSGYREEKKNATLGYFIFLEKSDGESLSLETPPKRERESSALSFKKTLGRKGGERERMEEREVRNCCCFFFPLSSRGQSES